MDTITNIETDNECIFICGAKEPRILVFVRGDYIATYIIYAWRMRHEYLCGVRDKFVAHGAVHVIFMHWNGGWTNYLAYMNHLNSMLLGSCFLRYVV